jgi:hypothetical protein
MITPLFVFTVFMLTLGPIKTVPAFFAMTQRRRTLRGRSRCTERWWRLQSPF